MTVKIIACIGKNNELGKDNDLIWHLPKDLKFFKQVTKGGTILMGLNTFKSLPKLLPNRKHVVLTDEEVKLPKEVKVVKSYDEALEYMATLEEIFIVGGASIYNLFIHLADVIYLTEVNLAAEADVYFPKFNKSKYIRQIVEKNSDGDIKYNHVMYVKRIEL